MVAVRLDLHCKCCRHLQFATGDRMNFIVSIVLPTGDKVTKAVGAGEIAPVAIKSPYLISKDQAIEFGIGVRRIISKEDYLGYSIKGKVQDVVSVPMSYDYSIMPSARHLSDILIDAVQHGIDNPTHGLACICMDKYVREVRAHISKAVPPDRGQTDDVHTRLDGRFRIAHVLKLAARDL